MQIHMGTYLNMEQTEFCPLMGARVSKVCYQCDQWTIPQADFYFIPDRNYWTHKTLYLLQFIISERHFPNGARVGMGPYFLASWSLPYSSSCMQVLPITPTHDILKLGRPWHRSSHKRQASNLAEQGWTRALGFFYCVGFHQAHASNSRGRGSCARHKWETNR